MPTLHTAPTEACSPDPDRDDPDSPALMPEWLAYLIAVVIVFIIKQFLAIQPRPARRMAARPLARPALPRDSAQPSGASIRTQSAAVTARTHPHDGIAPGSLTLAGALAALRDKLQDSEDGPAVWSQLEALGIVPGPLGPDTAAAPAAPVPSSRRVATNVRNTAPRSAPAGARHAEPPAFARHSFARAGTGPPTGPPYVPAYQSCYA